MEKNLFWQDYENQVRSWLPKEVKETSTFFRDGIVGDEEEYRKASIRPLFILKEVNQQETCDTCACRNDCGNNAQIKPNTVDFCKCAEGFASGNRLWKRVAKLEQILLGLHSDCNSNRIQHSAVINLKKIQGGSRDDSPESLRTLHYACHAVISAEKLRSQIAEIAPNIILCGGTFDVAEKCGLFGKEDIKEVTKFESLTGLRAAYSLRIESQNVVIIDMIHPGRLGYCAFCDEISKVMNRK